MKVYLPELNYWFSQYWLLYGDVTVHQASIPVIDDDIEDTSSVFCLLFNPAFSSLSYRYLFEKKTLLSRSKKIVERLITYGSFSEIYEASEDGDNILDFQDDDIFMFDTLLTLRLTGECDIDEINYESLNTNISKLLFVYIDMLYNNNFECVNYLETIDPSNIIEQMLKLFVINESHRAIRDSRLIIDSAEVRLYPYRRLYTLTSAILETRRIIVTGKIYNNLYHVFLDGFLLEEDDFNITELSGEEYDYDDVSFLISWDADNDIFKENSILIIDFYSDVKGVQHECSIDTVFLNNLHAINTYRKNRFPEFYINTEDSLTKFDFWHDNIDLPEPTFDPFEDRVEDVYWYEYMLDLGKASTDD